ncbi:hypothetical protein GCM10008018_04720 [Paenibacillus marchantiophytorum]|uniref:AraC family transcriptional regulator n=1 Tax=Paenibacillus marchantiophytorum TaxID=1619310 RepID=A0ABQ2BQZ2_9BACL|nr:AraC family transcriptional regulator [Paenibacillus marchantiophytorum]GGI43958.1 hypothetical protein GCM10008018_04720 [Paenibacillus marchantiophytorum]
MAAEQSSLFKTGYETLDEIWIKLRAVECVEHKGWHLSLEFRQSHTLFVAINSQVKIVVDGLISFLNPGSAHISLPGQLVQATVVGGNGKGLFVFQFDVIQEAEVAERGLEISRANSSFPKQGAVLLRDQAGIAVLCTSIIGYWLMVSALNRMRGQAAFQDLLCRLLQDALSDVIDLDSEAPITRTKIYMEQHFAKNITIDELANMAGVSRYYYMRTFKQMNGRSVMDYLSELRINQAKILMEKTKIRMRDIARQVGYNDEYYFIRKFKQQVGIPPATYIKNRQRKVAAYSFPNIGQLLALKIVPYAAPMDHAWTDMYRRKYQSDVVTKLSHDYAFNHEALRTAKPDYIIGIDHFVPKEEQEKLQQLAPAYFVPWLGHDWREHLRMTSDFLGVGADAEHWLEEYDRKAKLLRGQVQRVLNDDTVMIVQVADEACYVYGERSIGSVLYQDLGLNCPDPVRAIGSHAPVTCKMMSEYDADRIFVMFTNGRNVQENWDMLQHNEDWRGLRAVRNQAVSLISPWLWFEYSAFTQDRFLSEVSSLFKA